MRESGEKCIFRLFSAVVKNIILQVVRGVLKCSPEQKTSEKAKKNDFYFWSRPSLILTKAVLNAEINNNPSARFIMTILGISKWILGRHSCKIRFNL